MVMSYISHRGSPLKNYLNLSYLICTATLYFRFHEAIGQPDSVKYYPHGKDVYVSKPQFTKSSFAKIFLSFYTVITPEINGGQLMN